MAFISSRSPARRIRAKRRQRHCESCGKHSFDLGLRDLETPLTKRGHEQAGETGRYLSSRYKFDVIFSSPYHRALQTAEDLTSALPNSPPLVLEERIREIEFGILTDSRARASSQDFRRSMSAANGKANTGIATRR